MMLCCDFLFLFRSTRLIGLSAQVDVFAHQDAATLSRTQCSAATVDNRVYHQTVVPATHADTHHASYPRQSAVQAVQHRQSVYCPSGHVMQVNQDGIQTWCCDVCRMTQSAGARRLQCKECDYDVCEQCNPQKRASHPAQLKRWIYSSEQH